MEKFISEYFDENDVTNDREIRLSERCLDFKKIFQESRMFLTALIVADLIVLYELGFYWMMSKASIFGAIAAMVVVKIVIDLGVRTFLGNLIGMGINVLMMVFLILTKTIDEALLALSLVLMVIHFIRIKSCYSVAILKKVYGFPSFNGFLIANEAKADKGLFSIIRQQYNEAAARPIIRDYIIGLHKGMAVRVTRLISLLVLIAGAVFLYNVMSWDSTAESAIPLSLNMEIKEGTAVRGETDFLYSQLGISIEAMTEDTYWARIGDKVTGKYIPITVPLGLKLQFAELYNAFAPMDYTTGRYIYYQGYVGTTSKNEAPLSFIGIVRKDGKFDLIDYNEKKLDPEIRDRCVTGKYIEIYDTDVFTGRRKTGMLLLIGGGALLVLSNILFFTNRHRIQDI